MLAARQNKGSAVRRKQLPKHNMVQRDVKQRHTSEPFKKSINKVIFDATLFEDFMSPVYHTSCMSFMYF